MNLELLELLEGVAVSNNIVPYTQQHNINLKHCSAMLKKTGKTEPPLLKKSMKKFPHMYQKTRQKEPGQPATTHIKKVER